MKLFAVIFTVATLFASSEVEVSPGGPFIKLTGTVEEVHDELLRLNPSYDAQFTPIPARRAAAHALEPHNNTTSLLQLRPDFIRCGVFYRQARVARIKEGIAYLRTVSGVPSMGTGCGKVSCSWQSAIYWCNANDQVKTLDSWHNIADGAQLIVDVCRGQSPDVTGGRFHGDGWAVAVKGKTSCSDRKDAHLLKYFETWRRQYLAEKDGN
ncbi:hypothetical protein QBC44DRAFT_398616 [Cladorrhinum sp. PSN332]|nr:hypothetical protein QBC44DRAFT_398616 [Cladorrhinum sp. PSN332]